MRACEVSSMMPAWFWFSKETCIARWCVRLTWPLVVLYLQFPAHFQHAVCLTLKWLQNAEFLDIPLVQSGSVSQRVLQFLACLFTPAPNPEGSREAQPVAAPWAAVRLTSHLPFLLLTESQIPGVGAEVQATQRNGIWLFWCLHLPSSLYSRQEVTDTRWHFQKNKTKRCCLTLKLSSQFSTCLEAS